MRTVAAAAVPTALVAGLGGANGGYDAPTWGWATLALLPLLAAASAVARRPPREALLPLVALLALLAWASASLFWTVHLEATVLELQRLLLYAVVAATLAVVVRPGCGAAALGGVAAGCVVVCGWALSDRLLAREQDLAELVADPVAAHKLAGPVGYSNALALVAVIGLLLCAGFAARAALGWRVAAGAVVPLLAATLYLTLGRGAWIALAAGLATAVGLAERRLRLSLAFVALAPAGGLAVVAAAQSPAELPLDERGDGVGLTVTLVLLAAASAVVASVAPVVADRIESPAIPRRALLAAAAAIAAVCVAAAAFVAGDVAEAFSEPSAGGETRPAERLLSLSGSGRAAYWRVALDLAGDHPAVGAGAGTWGRAWLERREEPLPARDAHNLYVETLAELGPVGLALVVLFVGAAAAAAVRVRGAPFAAPAAGAAAAYAVHAASDWHWEMPVTTVAFLAVTAGLAALSPRDRPRVRRSFRLAAVAAAAVVAPLAVGALVGNLAVERAEDRYDGLDYDAAVSDAVHARRWAPWAVEPLRIEGEARLAQGDVPGARRAFRRGLAKDGRSWELWLDLALATEGRASARALARAQALNPLAPDIRELAAAGN